MKFSIEVHDPGSGSVKPIDRYETEDATEALGTALYFGQHGRAVMIREIVESQCAEPAGVAPGNQTQ